MDYQHSYEIPTEDDYELQEHWDNFFDDEDE